MSDIKLTTKQRNWRWLGHTIMKGLDDLTNQALTDSAGNYKGKRKSGRLKQPGGGNSYVNLKIRNIIS